MCANNDKRKPHKEHRHKEIKRFFGVFFFLMCTANLGCSESTDVLTHGNAANFTAGRPRSNQRQEGQVTRSEVERQKAPAEAGVRVLNPCTPCTPSRLLSNDGAGRKSLVKINTADRFLLGDFILLNVWGEKKIILASKFMQYSVSSFPKLAEFTHSWSLPTIVRALYCMWAT